MSEGVKQCFSANPIDLAADCGPKLTWIALNMNPVVGRILESGLSRQMGECRLNTHGAIDRAEVPQGHASLLCNLLHELQNTAKHRPRRRILGHVILGDI